MIKEINTRKDVAEILSCSPHTVDNLRRAGKLVPIKLGSLVRYAKADIEKLLEQSRKEAV